MVKTHLFSPILMSVYVCESRGLEERTVSRRMLHFVQSTRISRFSLNCQKVYEITTQGVKGKKMARLRLSSNLVPTLGFVNGTIFFFFFLAGKERIITPTLLPHSIA